MSLFFVYPIFLFGLAAASLPLVIHLLNRRKLNRIRFPAVRFILMSQKRISRSYRLRHWLLLALRTLAVVLLALLLANPVFQTGAGLFAGSGPVSLVVLLDNSLSMTWSGDGIGFKQAKEAARLLISALNDGDRAAVIPTTLAGKEASRLKSDKDVLLKDLEQIEIADGTADFATALGKAYELLNEPAGQKEIRLITDLGLTGWDRFAMSSLKQVDAAVPVKVIRIGRKQAALNATVRQIRVAGQGVGVDLPLHIEAIVTNFSDQEISDLLVQLSINGQSRDQKLTSLPPKGESTVAFQTRLPRAGSYAGQVTLKKDGLAGNPLAYFGLQAHDKLRVLLVDGDPQTSLVQSETFFLTRALNPAGERDASQYLPTVIIPEGLNTAELDAYEVIVLCNVATLPDNFIARLQAYVRQGGGLLIFGGDRLQAANYNAKLSGFLPSNLGDRKVAAESAGEKIAKLDLTHPALQGFSDPLLEESLRSARVWGYTRIPASGAVLASLANGDPLMVEQKVGSGRVIFIATSADRDWSDLPLKTAYLPLIQSLTTHLAGGKRGAMDGGIDVGSVKEFSLPPQYVGQTFRITKPDKQHAIIAMGPTAERAVGSFDENDRAGIYRLAAAEGGDKALGAPQLYAVNAPFLESRLDEIGEDELRAKLSPVKAEVVPVEALEHGGTRTDLAMPLLVLLMAILLLEGWFAQRI